MLLVLLIVPAFAQQSTLKLTFSPEAEKYDQATAEYQAIWTSEGKNIIEAIGNKLSPYAKLIWGAQISPDMEKAIRVLLIVTGVKSSQILGHGETIESMKHREIEEELGIEFIE